MKLSDKLKHNPINLLYDEAGLTNRIRWSLTFILLGNIFGSAHGVICGGGTTAMIGLATELGANDLAFGILAAIPQMAALLQLPFSFLVSRTQKRKKYLLTLGIGSRALWVLFGLVPYILPMASATLQLWIIIFLLGISSCCGSVINVCWFPWLSELLPMRIRGRFLSVRESIIAASSAVFGFITAFLLENLPIDIRYAIIFVIGGVVGILDMAAFGFCEEVYTTPPQKQSIFKTMGDVLKNKPFVRFTIMWTIWCFAANMSGVYLHPYSMNVMGLGFMEIMIFANIASAVVTIFIMPVWGKLLDNFGCRNVMLISSVVASLSPLFYLFSSPGNIWPTLLHHTVGPLFWCGANLTANNMQIICSPTDTRPTHMAFFSCITAFAGSMLGSLAGGALLETWNSAGMFTGTLDRYKVLFILACTIRIVGVLVMVPMFDKDSEQKPMDMVKHMAASVIYPIRRLISHR